MKKVSRNIPGLAAIQAAKHSVRGGMASLDRLQLIERATQIVSELSDDQVQLSRSASRLLDLSLEATGAAACALFRSVQETGLLVRVGDLVLSANPTVEPKRLQRLMTRAADHAASAINSLWSAEWTRLTTNTRHKLRIRLPSHVRSVLGVRSTSTGNLVVYANLILRQDIEQVLLEQQEAVPTPQVSPNTAGEAQCQIAEPIVPQVLGVFVTVLRRDGWSRTPSSSMPSKSKTIGVQTGGERARTQSIGRLHGHFSLLLRQQAWRDAADIARRQTEKRLREVATIYEIGRAVSLSDSEGLFKLITRKAAAVMDSAACSLLVKPEDSNELYIAASYGLPDDVVENSKIFVGKGIAGRVAQTGEPMVINADARLDPRLAGTDITGLPGISSSISVPMKGENNQVHGVLCIRRITPSPPFSAEDVRLFNIFASQASMAIKNARLYNQLRRRVQELSTLSSLTEAISSTLNLDYVLNQIADNLVTVVGFDRCLIYLREDVGDQFIPRITRGFDDAAGVSLSDGAGVFDPAQTSLFEPQYASRTAQELIGLIAQKMLSLFVEEDDQSLPVARAFAEALGLRSFYAQSIVVRGRAIGVLVVSTDITRRPLIQANLDLMATFIQHAGIAIENARLYAQLERQVSELNTLYTMSRSLTTTYGLSQASATVNRVAAQITSSEGALLLLFNEQLDNLRIFHHFGLTSALEDLTCLLPDSRDVQLHTRLLHEPLTLHVGTYDTGLFGGSWRILMDELGGQYPTLLLVPLITEETNVGFILLGRHARTQYRQDELKLVSIISSQAAAALRNAALYEQSVEQRVLELSALYELSKKVRTATSLRDVFEAILDIVASVVACDEAFLYTIDPERQVLQLQAISNGSEGRSSGAIGERTRPSGVNVGKALPLEQNTIADWVMQERKALLINDLVGDTRFAYGFRSRQTRSLMAIPVFLGDDTMAVLQVGSSNVNLYTEQNVKMLSLIAAQAAALFIEIEQFRELTTYTDNILRSIAAGVVTLDSAGRVVTFNSAAERILRLKSSQVLGNWFSEVVPLLHADAADEEDTIRMVSLAVETGQTVQRHRLRFCPQEGVDPVIVNGSVSQLQNERGEYIGVVLVFEDITKQSEMEQELTRMGRLAEIGELAAGIAHELRNPLTSIKGAAQIVSRDLKEQLRDDHREFLEQIVAEVDVLNGITTEFLDFSRSAPPLIGAVDINALLARRIQFMRAEFERYDIAVHEEYAQNLPQLEVDSGQMERLFMNIILNAIQAMLDGGVLSVTTSLAGSRDDVVDLRFRDTGVGMPQERMNRIFVPFFTTKTKGTGLGLAIVQKTVDAHGGRIQVSSEPGKGTTFIISIPAVSPLSRTHGLAPSEDIQINTHRLDTSHRVELRSPAD